MLRYPECATYFFPLQSVQIGCGAHPAPQSTDTVADPKCLYVVLRENFACECCDLKWSDGGSIRIWETNFSAKLGFVKFLAKQSVSGSDRSVLRRIIIDSLNSAGSFCRRLWPLGSRRDSLQFIYLEGSSSFYDITSNYGIKQIHTKRLKKSYIHIKFLHEICALLGHYAAYSGILVHYTTRCKHSLVLLRMGEIIARNLLS